MVEECVCIEDAEGLTDVVDTIGVSAGFEDVLLVLSEVAEVGFVAKLVRVTVLVCDSVGLFVVAVVWTVVSDGSLV